HPRAECAERNAILFLARDCARMTADALSLIDDESVSHTRAPAMITKLCEKRARVSACDSVLARELRSEIVQRPHQCEWRGLSEAAERCELDRLGEIAKSNQGGVAFARCEQLIDHREQARGT